MPIGSQFAPPGTVARLYAAGRSSYELVPYGSWDDDRYWQGPQWHLCLAHVTSDGIVHPHFDRIDPIQAALIVAALRGEATQP